MTLKNGLKNGLKCPGARFFFSSGPKVLHRRGGEAKPGVYSPWAQYGTQKSLVQVSLNEPPTPQNVEKVSFNEPPYPSRTSKMST